MKYAAAHPDSFSKMSAAFAKIPFCYDVIMEQTLYLVGLIGKHEELMALLTSTMKGGSNYSTYKVLRNFLGSEFEKLSFTNLESGKKIEQLQS